MGSRWDFCFTRVQASSRFQIGLRIWKKANIVLIILRVWKSIALILLCYYLVVLVVVLVTKWCVHALTSVLSTMQMWSRCIRGRIKVRALSKITAVSIRLEGELSRWRVVEEHCRARLSSQSIDRKVHWSDHLFQTHWTGCGVWTFSNASF